MVNGPASKFNVYKTTSLKHIHALFKTRVAEEKYSQKILNFTVETNYKLIKKEILFSAGMQQNI